MQCQFCRQMVEDKDALQLHYVGSCPAIEQGNAPLDIIPSVDLTDKSFENASIATDQPLSPLHREMLDHQIQNGDYNFINMQGSIGELGNLLSEEKILLSTTVEDDPSSLPLSLQGKIIDEPTLNHVDNLSLSFSPGRDHTIGSDIDESFYRSCGTPPGFKTNSASPKLSPRNNLPSLYGNIEEMLNGNLPVGREGAVSRYGYKPNDEGISEPSLQSSADKDLLEQELEDAMRDIGLSQNLKQESHGDDSVEFTNDQHHPNYSHNSVDFHIERNGSAQRSVIVIEDDAEEKYPDECNADKDKMINIKNLQVKCNSYESEMIRLNHEVARLGELLQNEKTTRKELEGKYNSNVKELGSLNEICRRHKQEVSRLTLLMNDYEDVKTNLEGKCNSYHEEVDMLKQRCIQLKQRKESQNKDKDLAENNIIDELRVTAESCEYEMNRLKQECEQLKGTLEEYKRAKVQLETKCLSFSEEVRRLNSKCEELELKENCHQKHEEADLNVKNKSYKAEIRRLDKEVQRLLLLVDDYKEKETEHHVQNESYETEVKRLKQKCIELEREKDNLSNDQDLTKDQLIGDLKVKADSCESEMNRLNQEVKRQSDLLDEYKNLNFQLESRCQSYGAEIDQLRSRMELIGNGNHLRNEIVDDSMTNSLQLDAKCNNLKSLNEKLLDDYRGLEEAKRIQQEEVQLERERWQSQMKELQRENSELRTQQVLKTRHVKYDNTDNHARLNIDKLKTENQLLKEKLSTIRLESELDNATSHDEISPIQSACKPHILSKNPIYATETDYNKNYSHKSRSNRHENFSTNFPNDDYTSVNGTLPSRYNANRYSKSVEPYDPGEYTSRHDSNDNEHLNNIMERYSMNNGTKSKPRLRMSCGDDINEFFSTKRILDKYESKAHHRSRSLDRGLRLSGADTDSAYTTHNSNMKYASLSRMPFCPTTIKDLSLGMKISVNRSNRSLSRGTVKWIGTLPHHIGDYVGVELESETGKHDGFFEGVQYFRCKPDRGVFVKFPKVIMAWK